MIFRTCFVLECNSIGKYNKKSDNDEESAVEDCNNLDYSFLCKAVIVMKIRCQVTSLVDSYLASSLTGLAGEKNSKLFFLLLKFNSIRPENTKIMREKNSFL